MNAPTDALPLRFAHYRAVPGHARLRQPASQTQKRTSSAPPQPQHRPARRSIDQRPTPRQARARTQAVRPEEPHATPLCATTHRHRRTMPSMSRHRHCATVRADRNESRPRRSRPTMHRAARATPPALLHRQGHHARSSLTPHRTTERTHHRRTRTRMLRAPMREQTKLMHKQRRRRRTHSRSRCKFRTCVRSYGCEMTS